ncbi:MAG: hypothetical protein ABR987_17110 [Terracidiphilus sp.]
MSILFLGGSDHANSSGAIFANRHWTDAVHTILGASMSINAFPVLAGILKELGIEPSFLGATALICVAVDDVAA